MTIERRRPLPAGRYWVDIFERDRPQWAAWISVQQNAGNAKVEATEHFPGDESKDLEERDWVLFVTTAETVWPDADMGLAPNIAGKDVHSSTDTIDRPPPEPDPLERLERMGDTLVRGVMTAGAVAVGVLVLVGVVSMLKKRKSRS
jgi:hypothetical protein